MTNITETVEEKRGYATGMAVYETYGDDVVTVEKPYGMRLNPIFDREIRSFRPACGRGREGSGRSWTVAEIVSLVSA